MLAPPTSPAAWVDYTQGLAGGYGVFRTNGFAPRSGIRVWHVEGYWWAVWYRNTSGSVSGFYQHYTNPVWSPYSHSYARSECENSNENGTNVWWTCQTLN